MEILIVDNNREFIETMMILLNNKNYTVTAVGNGQEALEKLRSGKYDLIISEILMPVMDGFRLCWECKKDPELNSVSFIFHTATYIDKNDKKLAMALGAQKIIRKSQKPEVLANLIQDVIKQPQKQKKTNKKYEDIDDEEIFRLYSMCLVARLEKINFDREHEIASHATSLNKLKESEDKFHSFIGQSSEGMIMANEDGFIIECNEAAESITGLKTEQIVGIPFWELQFNLTPPGSDMKSKIKSFKDILPDVIRTGKSEYFEKPFTVNLLTPKGEYKTILQSVFPIRTNRGFHIGAILNDVTKYTRTEEALTREQYLFNSLIETTPDNIYFKDKESCFIRINKPMAQRFGLSDPQEAFGKTDFDFFDEEHARPAFEDEQRIIVTGESLIGLEEKEVWPDGHITWVSTTKLPLCDKTGNIIGIMGISRDITDRKLAEEALQESEDKYRSIVETTTEWIWEIDLSAKHTFSNQGVTAILGYPPEEFIGQDAVSLLHEKDRSEVETKLQEFIAEKRGWRGWILRWRHKDGSYRFLESNANPMLDSGGHIRGYRGSDRDITERILAGETIEKERTLLRTIIDNLPSGIFVKDKEYRKIIVNPVHAKEVKGHLKTLDMNCDIDILGKTDFEVFSGELAEKFYADDQKVIRDGLEILNTEGIGYYEDGKQQWMLVSKIPLLNKNREIIGMVGVTTDITERRQAEEALKTSEEKFRKIFDNASDGMFLLDPETGRFIMCNAACLKMLGYSHDEFINLDIKTIHPSEELPSIHGQIEKVSRGEKGLRNDIIFKRKDDTLFTADLSPTIVPIAGKRLVLIVFSDITERLHIENELRAAKEKAEESDRLKTAFLHNISHEIRTPMNAVTGFAELLNNPDLPFNKRVHYTELICNSSNQLLSIITDIINIATIESGQEKVVEKTVNLNYLLNTLHQQYEPKAKAKSIHLDVKTSLLDPEAEVVTDEIKLIQILSNLINNALKFTKKGSVSVRYEVKKVLLEFSVSDTGIGIPADMHEKIFERFLQVNHTVSREYEGTGLGLSISKAYVELLGGDIWLTSEPGKGSVFYFTIPFIRKPTIRIPKPIVPTEKELHFDKSGTILVAEDEEANYCLIEEYLESTNLTIVRATTGVEAVELCKSNASIVLVLMDIKMPRMDGYEATRKIRATQPDLPIIALTAYAQAEDEGKALNAGCSAYIPKPVSRVLLHSVIEKFLLKEREKV